MKILCIVLALLTLFILSGCEDSPTVEDSTEIKATEEPAPLIPEPEYADISEQMLSMNTYGKVATECGFNEDNCFLKDEKVNGYDYVSLFDVKGSLSVYLADGRVSSIVFGSEPFENAAQFDVAYSTVNEKLAGKLGVDIISPVLIGADESDDSQMLLNGKGYYLIEYKTDTIHVSLRSCGVKGTATIVVECSPAK